MPEINKKVIYILVAVALIIVIVLVYFAFRSQPTAPNNNDQLTLQTQSGKEIQTNNFIANAQSVDLSAVTLKDIPDVAVFMYNTNSKIFTILIHAQDQQTFDQKRTIAEKSFVDQLGITQSQACDLKVELSSDGPETDLQEFSKPQSLSFCK